MNAKRNRLTLDLEPAFHRQLKAIAAVNGVSMLEYCVNAIKQEMVDDQRMGNFEEGFAPAALRVANSSGCCQRGRMGGRVDLYPPDTLTGVCNDRYEGAW